MQVRHEGSVQERADKFQDLSISAAQKKEVDDWTAGILPRLIKKCSYFENSAGQWDPTRKR